MKKTETRKKTGPMKQNIEKKNHGHYNKM